VSVIKVVVLNAIGCVMAVVVIVVVVLLVVVIAVVVAFCSNMWWCSGSCYARKQLLLSARLSRRNSVRLSVRHMGDSVKNGPS